MNYLNCPLNDYEIQEKLNLIKKKVSANISTEKLKKALSCIDLTTLNTTDTISRVESFTEKVNTFNYRFPNLKNVAAICVYPNMVGAVKKYLTDTNIHIASVAGGFPSSMTFSELKNEEARHAVKMGADEIDIVLPLWAFLDKNTELCKQEISAIKKAIGNAHLKVILESGILNDPDKIWEASFISMESGADFIKTSTGKTPPAATPEAALIMCLAIKKFFESTGKKIGFKPAGGISTAEQAILYLTIVEDILGADWINPELFRIGASRLANNLLEAIIGKGSEHF